MSSFMVVCIVLTALLVGATAAHKVRKALRRPSSAAADEKARVAPERAARAWIGRRQRCPCGSEKAVMSCCGFEIARDPRRAGFMLPLSLVDREAERKKAQARMSA